MSILNGKMKCIGIYKSQYIFKKLLTHYKNYGIIIIEKEREVMIMTEIRYRLVFRDGSHSAWSTDLERIQESAKFFRAEIEKWVVELP